MTTRIVAMIVIAVAMIGCSKEITWQDLEKIDGKSGDAFGLGPHIKYCGSDDEKHYFIVIGLNGLDDRIDAWTRKSSTAVKIKEITHSSDESKWVDLQRIPTSSGIGYLGGLDSLKQ